MEYPEFLDDQLYLDMDDSVSETDQLRAMLSNLTRIHLLTANKFENFDELIREYIISGIEVFGLETGIVSEVVSDIYRVCDVVSPLDVLEKGQEFQLEDTYCREVVKSQKVVCFPEVGKLDYMNCHPVYQNLKLEAYLSAPIFVGDTLFGTFNFTSTKPRVRGFSKHERNLIVLMANSIGNFILLRNKEEKLVELNNRIKRFVGYVAHDLRNPIGSIISYAKLGSRKGLAEEKIVLINQRIEHAGEQALEFVSTILENAALSTGKITLSQSKIGIAELLEQAVTSVELYIENSQAKIVLDIENECAVECDVRRINQSLMNLLINAIKYSPKAGVITLQAKIEGGSCHIAVLNDIAKNNIEAKPENNKLYGSVGFGLDIVSQVLQAHGAELNISEDNQRYSATFILPIV